MYFSTNYFVKILELDEFFSVSDPNSNKAVNFCNEGHVSLSSLKLELTYVGHQLTSFLFPEFLGNDLRAFLSEQIFFSGAQG